MKDALFIIAEAGVNHNGRLDLALQLIDAAAAAGADAVKFQTFRAESLATPSAPKAKYQETAGAGGQLAMLRALELDARAHGELARRCSERGIEFMSTPFDVESVALLDSLGMRRFKVPSGEIDNPLLLRAVARTGKPLIVSSGMSTLTDVEFALRTIARVISPDAGPEPLWTDEGAATLRDRVTLLHCTTEYPAPPEAVNLRAMTSLGRAFGVAFGYSDHTEGLAVPCAAIALGATVIEKHFTLDRALPGPDHAASLPAADLEHFVRTLRDVKVALGHGRKVPAGVEIPNRAVARRSIVARTPIARGEALSELNLTVKRPGTGMAASRFDEVIGKPASRAYGVDDLIDE